MKSAASDMKYLIVKRGLYYRPNSQGYTGLRDEAGRYTHEYCMSLDKADGITFIHEDEALEFMPATYSDVLIKHLIKQRDEARAALKVKPVVDIDAAVQAMQEIAVKELSLMLADEDALTLATTALPHLQLGFEVKQLEWVKIHSCNGILSAKTHFGTYFIGSSKTVRLGLKTLSRPFQLLDEAKAAAQADFERRVRECHVATATNDGTKPVDVAAVNFNEIFSDLLSHVSAWKNGLCIAMLHAETKLPDIDDKSYWRHEINALDNIEVAIRALSAEPAQGARPLEEWHEDHGNVVWWAWDNDRKTWLGEPAYIGKPLDSDWPEYHTHWTPHPTFPAAPTTEAGR